MRWNRVEDGLPEQDMPCMLRTEMGATLIGYLDNNGNWIKYYRNEELNEQLTGTVVAWLSF